MGLRPRRRRRARHGLDLDGDGNATEASPDERFFYQQDAQGNVIGLTSSAGHLVEGYAYEAYGNVSILLPATGAQGVKWDGTDQVSTQVWAGDPSPHPYSSKGNLWFFTGRQYDPEIGSYNYRARQYHPTLGQFMSVDPTGAWGDAIGLGNAYSGGQTLKNVLQECLGSPGPVSWPEFHSTGPRYPLADVA